MDIRLHKQYHLIRLLKSSRNDQGLFLYLEGYQKLSSAGFRGSPSDC